MFRQDQQYQQEQKVVAPESGVSAPVQLHYQEKTLTQIQKKSAGKNQSSLDGFYRDEAGEEYFIKVPRDKRELFTEVFAGRVLTKLKEEKWIEPQYHDLLICADLIKLPEGGYGLIQPKRKFTEIWKYFQENQLGQTHNGVFTKPWEIINGAISGANDRKVLDEMLFGREHYYLLLAQLNSLPTLAACILYSLMIGDYSVHSSNIVFFEEEKAEQPEDLAASLVLVDKRSVRFGRIDWGAAWRYYGRQQNQDVMKPYAYHGYKGFTKGYHWFYELVPGLFQEVSAQAQVLKRSLENPDYFAVFAAILGELNPP